MRRRTNLILNLGLFLSLFLLPSKAYAGIQDFTIDRFDANYVVKGKDAPGGMIVTEDIDVTFSDNNHGILRAIPIKYKDQSLDLHVSKVESSLGTPSGFTTYQENGNTVIKIGDANRTVTGKQNYKITYTVNNVISFYDTHDELYWDINGDGWLQPTTKVTASFQIPMDLTLQSDKLVCYAGSYGLNEKKCVVSFNNQQITSETTEGLDPGQTLTVIAGFDKGYFRPLSAFQKAMNVLVQVFPIFIMPAIIGFYAFNKWRKFGRDPKGRGTIVPEYGPPDNLFPIEVGAIMDFNPDNKDLSAEIISLAIKGHIRIIEQIKKVTLGKDKKIYSFEVFRKDESKLIEADRKILAGLRSVVPTAGAVAGPSVTVSTDDLKTKFYTTASSVRSEVLSDLTERGYFKKNPKRASLSLILISVGLFLFSTSFAILFGIFFLLGCIIAAVMSLLTAIFMSARTEKGVDARDSIEGLKLYLNTAEKDRIAMLQSPESPYANKEKAPKMTVRLFEKLLPYAMVLNVENEWAKQFKDIYTQAPDWYSGNWSTFNAVALTHSINTSMLSATSVAFASPTSSSGSGFSGGGGGGFSGGGGGGGGGGGW